MNEADSSGDKPSANLGPPDQGSGSNGRRTRVLLIITSLFLLAGLAWLLAWVFVFSQRVVTEDAYVQGNQTIISSRIPGTVIAVLAEDTDRVETGQVLARLDPADAEAALAGARSALAGAVRQVRQMQAQAEQADAAVEARAAALAMAQANLARREPLLADQAVARETLDNLRDQIRSARAELKLARHQASAAHAAVDGTSIADNPQVLQARAQFQQAWLNAHRTAVVAPVTGYVANRSVQVGQQVAAGTPLMQVIPLDHLWIDANFKESQLRHVRIGQPVTISVDLYGSKIAYHGTVAGLSPGTGAAFALLPPQNASGNWIKVVQRVPVRIELDPAELRKHPLRVGLSTKVSVNIRDHSGEVLAEQPTDRSATIAAVPVAGYADADREAEAIIRANLGTPADD